MPANHFSVSDASLPPEPEREPCPAPLAWQEIAQSFHQTATSRIVSTELAEVKVTEFGTGHPIVFFPAMCGSSRLFCLTAWLLKEDFRSILIEAPKLRRRISPLHLVKRLADTYSMVIEHLVPGGADVYASTFSGQVALELMNSRPGVIRSAVLQSAWGHRKFTGFEQAVLRAGASCPLKLKHVPLWKTTQIENHRRWFPPFDETRFGFLLQETGETKAPQLARMLLASAQCDLRPLLPVIRQRVLILKCEGDGDQVDAAERELESRIPGAQTEEMSHSGFYPYLTHPHRLVKIIKPFWKEGALAADGSKND